MYSQGGRQEGSFLLGLLSALWFAAAPGKASHELDVSPGSLLPVRRAHLDPLAEHPWQFISDTL